MKIICVIVSLTKDGFDTKEIQYNAVEKNRIFLLDRIDFDGEKITKQLKKCDLNNIMSVMNQTTNVALKIYTTPELVEEKKEVLKILVINACNYLKNNIDNLLKHI